MARYETKPIEIEAIKWDGENFEEIKNYIGKHAYFVEHGDRTYGSGSYVMGKELVIRTLEGDMYATVGDYIIKGLRGEFYPCKPDVFHKKYKLVD